jgi:hypothetical protein
MHANVPEASLRTSFQSPLAGFFSLPVASQFLHRIVFAPPHRTHAWYNQCPYASRIVATRVPQKHTCEATPRMPLMSSSAPIVVGV